MLSSSVLAWVVAAAVAPLEAQREVGWETIKTEEGITVSVREPPGELPTFRGQGAVDGPILHVLAILLDDRRSAEWFKSAHESYRLRDLDRLQSIVYSRARQTWPAQDREMILKRVVEVQAEGDTYFIRLVCITNPRPIPRGTVRLTDCETAFTLRKLAAGRTQVEHRVRADPGGSAPLFLARMLSKDVPLDLLKGLRKQVQRTRGQYAAAIAKWESIK